MEIFPKKPLWIENSWKYSEETVLDGGNMEIFHKKPLWIENSLEIFLRISLG
jgi:hypothetical protein